MPNKKSKISTKQTLAIFWHFTYQYKFLFWYATIGSIIAAIVSDILPPLVIALTFNKLQALVVTHQAITFPAVKNYLIAYIAVCGGSLVLWRTQAYASWKYIILAKTDIVNYIFNHIQTMDNKFHNNRFSGALVSQTNKFISAYEQFMGEFNWNILNGITAFIAALIVLLVTSLLYAGIFTLFAIAYFVIVYRQMKRQMPYNRDLSAEESHTTAKLADALTNMATVRAFAGEPFETKLFNQQTKTMMNKNLMLMRVQLKNELISQSGTEIVQVIAFIAGLISLCFLSAPIGVLYLTLTYTLNLTQRLWNFMFILRNLNKQFGDAADMTAILNLTSEIKDITQPEVCRITQGDIKFNNVIFAYPENIQNPLFNNLNLHIKAGEKVGLVGISGGGKTTVTKLLLRFMDIQAGEITIDGQNIAHIKQLDLRHQISYVPQDPILFHRTLAENISYGNPAADLTAIKHAAIMAHADEFITKLPEEYQTLVGERGVKLSGGQRQRVAIARAMLKNAPILILDEATSALDSESEVLIQEALWRLMQNRTAIVIAHRLSTIQKMDRIIVLDKGKIIEQGSHLELLHKNGSYAKLWKHQSGGFITENVEA